LVGGMGRAKKSSAMIPTTARTHQIEGLSLMP
jgi:hypothetical protein